MNLTEKLAGLLRFIESFIAERGYAPNYREMAAGSGVRSSSRIAECLDALAERGKIRRLSRRKRAIEVLRQPVDITLSVEAGLVKVECGPDVTVEWLEAHQQAIKLALSIRMAAIMYAPKGNTP